MPVGRKTKSRERQVTGKLKLFVICEAEGKLILMMRHTYMYRKYIYDGMIPGSKRERA